MKSLFRCEYCGRRIKTEECPYCGGINSLPLDRDKYSAKEIPVASGINTSEPFVPKKLTPYQKFVTFMRVHTIIRTVCIFFICMAAFIFALYLFFLANEEREPVTVNTNRILDIGLDYTVTATVFDKTVDITLPCSVGSLSNIMTIKEPIITDIENEDRNLDGIMDFAPYQGGFIFDENDLFTFSLINDSFDVVPYTQVNCDQITLMSYKYKDKLTSLKLNGNELLTDMDSVLDLLGDPTTYITNTEYSTIEYKTPYGHIRLDYYKEDNYDFPKYIYLSNLVQSRIYY